MAKLLKNTNIDTKIQYTKSGVKQYTQAWSAQFSKTDCLGP